MTALAIRDEQQYLATVDQVRELAMRITNIGDARDLAAKARAAEVWAQRAHLGKEKEALAIMARRWAERRAGELLILSRKNGERTGGRLEKESPSATLSDLGVTKHESSRWQKLAAIPVDEFDAVVSAAIGGAENDTKSAGRSARDAGKRKEREQAEADARQTIAEVGSAACRIDHATIDSWRPLGVSCIVTDPPYITADAVELHSQLADFALDVLPEHGGLAVMTWQPILPAVLEAMRRPRLVYRWTAAWVFETKQRTPERGPRVFDGWKPILVFHKDGWADDATYLYDVVASPDADKASHEWGQNIHGFRQLVRAFSKPGDTVCDPFVGGGTTAVAALAESRMFVGADADPASVQTASERVAA